jgi:site-specific recombinase XerD
MNSLKKVILKHQPNKQGYCTVYLEQYSHHNGGRSIIRRSTGVKVLPSSWSRSKQLILPTDENYQLKNKTLDQKYIEALNSLSFKPSLKASQLIKYLDSFIELKKLKGCKRTSFKEFITVRNRLIKYEDYRVSNGFKTLSFEEIGLRFSDDHIIWLSSKKYHPNTIKKHFVTIKTFLNHYYKRAEDYPDLNLNSDFRKEDFGRVTTHYTPPNPLTLDELKKLVGSDSKLKGLPKLIKAKDAFVFGCATGLRFGDLFKITASNIRNNIIYIEPSKTEGTKSDNLCKIPLNSISSNILNKYDMDMSKIRMTNQAYNKHLKKLFKLLSFDQIVSVKKYAGLAEPTIHEYPKHQLLSSHNARDTFITLAIKSGIDIPSIMEMTGHTKYETMRKYIKLDDEHLVTSMSKFCLTYDQLNSINGCVSHNEAIRLS